MFGVAVQVGSFQDSVGGGACEGADWAVGLEKCTAEVGLADADPDGGVGVAAGQAVLGGVQEPFGQHSRSVVGQGVGEGRPVQRPETELRLGAQAQRAELVSGQCSGQVSIGCVHGGGV